LKNEIKQTNKVMLILLLYFKKTNKMVLIKNTTSGLNSPNKSKHNNIYTGKLGWFKSFASTTTKKFFKSTKDIIEHILFVPDNQVLELQNKVNKLEKELENIKKIKSNNNKNLNEKGKVLLRSFETIKTKYQHDNNNESQSHIKNVNVPNVSKKIEIMKNQDANRVINKPPPPPPLSIIVGKTTSSVSSSASSSTTNNINTIKAKPPPPLLPPPSNKGTIITTTTTNNNKDKEETSTIPSRPKLLFNATELVTKKLKSINNNTNETNNVVINNQKRLFNSEDLQVLLSICIYL
jgi:hypothetical protein